MAGFDPTGTPRMNLAPLETRTSAQWDAEIVPQLTEYIRVPAKSPPRSFVERPNLTR